MPAGRKTAELLSSRESSRKRDAKKKAETESVFSRVVSSGTVMPLERRSCSSLDRCPTRKHGCYATLAKSEASKHDCAALTTPPQESADFKLESLRLQSPGLFAAAEA